MTALDEALLGWDGFRIDVSLDAVEVGVAELVQRSGILSNFSLSGHADVLEASATIRYKGMHSRIEIEITEVRLKARRLGFRLGRMKVLGGLRIPRRAVERVIKRVAKGRAVVIPGTGIVIIDLTDQIPPELEVRLLTLHVDGRRIRLWLGRGYLLDFPGRRRKPKTLPAEPPKLHSGT